MRFAEAKNLARSVHNDRPGKGAGTPERNQPMFDEVHSVLPPFSAADADAGRFGQRTRIAYDAYSETSPKLILQKRNTMVALRV